jgi:hypothetical protein
MITAETKSCARLAVALAPAFAGPYGRGSRGERTESYRFADPAAPTVWESQVASGGRG